MTAADSKMTAAISLPKRGWSPCAASNNDIQNCAGRRGRTAGAARSRRRHDSRRSTEATDFSAFMATRASSSNKKNRKVQLDV